MEARLVRELPAGPEWSYEPKWDGFRCLVFRDRKAIVLQSKSGQPLGRYFPELIRRIADIPARRFVLDGEIVVVRDGRLSFDDLLQRIHPAESRILKLSAQTPATLMMFDLLLDDRGRPLLELRLDERRKRLEKFADRLGLDARLALSPVERDRSVAAGWMKEYGAVGCDGVIAKRVDFNYRSGDRSGMVKVKRLRTADCVVGGFRYDQDGREIGSLLLGLYNRDGTLDHIGFTSSFTAEERRALKGVVLPKIGPPGFTGKAPGGPSRWSTKRSMEWEPLKPLLVCEVQFDHFSGGRFRHGTKFLRWRPDKKPAACTYAQLEDRRG